MTPDNPDPLEVWREAMEAHNAAFHDERDACPFEAATKAAAAIIAQHYAPVIAKNERLRAELARLNCAHSVLASGISPQALGAKP